MSFSFFFNYTLLFIYIYCRSFFADSFETSVKPLICTDLWFTLLNLCQKASVASEQDFTSPSVATFCEGRN